MPQESQAAWQRFGVLREQCLNTLPLAADHFEVAARLCLTQAPPLRAGSALHLTLCQLLNQPSARINRGQCKDSAHNLRVC